MVTDKDMTTMQNLAMPLYAVQSLAMPLYAVRNLAMPFYTVQDLTMPLFTAQGLTKSKRNKGEDYGEGGATQKLPREASRLNSSPEVLVARRAVHLCCLVPWWPYYVSVLGNK